MLHIYSNCLLTLIQIVLDTVLFRFLSKGKYVPFDQKSRDSRSQIRYAGLGMDDPL